MPSTPRHTHRASTSDGVWEKGLSALLTYVARRGHAQVTRQARAAGMDLAAWVRTQRAAYWDGELDDHHRHQLEALPGWAWGDPPPHSWRTGLAALTDFVATHNSALVPTTQLHAGIPLGRWCATQRQSYSHGTMSPKRIAQIERAAPGWQWDGDDQRWAEGLTKAHHYATNHDISAINRDCTHDGFSLGAWVHRWREDHRAHHLSAERTQQLEAINGWSWSPLTTAWDTAIAALDHYVQRHGHAAPKQHETVDDFPLGQWINQRRRDYHRGKLTPHKATTLESYPGWDWNPRTTRHRAGRHALATYIEQHGHASPATADIIDGFPIGEWVAAQRAQQRNGRLPAADVDYFESLPGWRWRTTKNAT